MNDEVLIVMATYNGGKYLNEQLDSLLQQTYPAWTLLVHDDGSTDETPALLRAYVKKYPDKIKILEDNTFFGSASLNFSHLLSMADAEYIMLCDQDDVWFPEKIEKTLQKMKAMELKYPDVPLLVHTDLNVVGENMELLDNSFWHFGNLDPKYDALSRLLMQNFITGCTVMLNRRLLRKAMPIPESAIMHDWWLGLVASRFGKIGFLPEATIAYRQHDNNDTGAKRFGTVEVLKRMRSYMDPQLLYRQLMRNRKQADAFLKYFGPELDEDEKEMLSAFAAMDTFSFVEKRALLFKYGLFKQGRVRNMGLLLCL